MNKEAANERDFIDEPSSNWLCVVCALSALLNKNYLLMAALRSPSENAEGEMSLAVLSNGKLVTEPYRASSKILHENLKA